MSTSTKMIIVLTVITMFSGIILSTWDGMTKPKIEAYKLQELKKAISEVLPSYDHYEEINSDSYTLYLGKTAGSDSTVGIACEVIGSGFQGKISIMLGLSPDFNEITGLKILEQIETPGLGTKIIEDPTNKSDPFWFTNQFENLHTRPVIEVVKNVKPQQDNEIQAITGATITSKAVVKIINDNLKNLRETYKNSENEITAF
jgi:electron transport complex protein RnfG